MALEIEVARRSAGALVGIAQGMMETTRANGDVTKSQRKRFRSELEAITRQDIMRHLGSLSQTAIVETRRSWETYTRERTGDPLIDGVLVNLVYDSAERMRDLIRDFPQ